MSMNLNVNPSMIGNYANTIKTWGGHVWRQAGHDIECIKHLGSAVSCAVQGNGKDAWEHIKGAGHELGGAFDEGVGALQQGVTLASGLGLMPPINIPIGTSTAEQSQNQPQATGKPI